MKHTAILCGGPCDRQIRHVQSGTWWIRTVTLEPFSVFDRGPLLVFQPRRFGIYERSHPVDQEGQTIPYVFKGYE